MNNKDKTITVNKIESPRKDQSALDNVFATIIPGDSIMLHANLYLSYRECKDRGLDPYPPPTEMRSTFFAIGDEAIYGSYNLIYTGKIVSITEKTVTIEEEPHNDQKQGKRHRLSLYDFAWRNKNYNASEIAEHNAETMRCI